MSIRFRTNVIFGNLNIFVLPLRRVIINSFKDEENVCNEFSKAAIDTRFADTPLHTLW